MGETTFENAKVGDRVWWLGKRRWGTIVSTDGLYSPLPIIVEFDGEPTSERQSFNSNGQWRKDQSQSLFWDEIKIDPPPRPKRKVVKLVELWANVFENAVMTTWATKQSADDNTKERYLGEDMERIACVHLTGTYEAEE